LNGLGETGGFCDSASYHHHKIDLTLGVDEIWRRCHKTAVRDMVHRAEREALSCTEGDNATVLPDFYTLHLGTRRRQLQPPHSLRWFRALIANFGRDLRIRVACKDGAPIAAILTLRHNRTVVYKYACSNAALHPLGGMALLLWRTIEEAKQEGATELDMGRCELENTGLATFKERWGADRVPLKYSIFPAECARSRGWAGKLALRVVKFVPDRVFANAGESLYRHFG